MTTHNFPLLRLNRNADKRLRQGHCWIYSNEVDIKVTPLRQFEAGQQVVVESAQGKQLGIAYVNPHSLICGRLVSRDLQYALDKSLLHHRLNIALALRERVFPEPFYRLVYGESDGLPGLVVDRFGDTLVVQINTAGMEAVKLEVVEALEACLKPARILFKNDSSGRQLEGLPESVEWVLGDAVDTLSLRENNASFEVSAEQGQKTGWFYDHRYNRRDMLPWVAGKRVLDVFSYVGGWGVQAAVAGASEVHCVDSSARALEFVDSNAALNGVESVVSAIKGSAFDVLEELCEQGERYDVVVLDPPAFIKRRKDSNAGAKAYKRINQLGMRLLGKDGLLVSASCSMHFSRAELTDTLRAASRHVERNLQIVQQGGQGPDHPVHPAITETEYLKAAFCRVFTD